MGVADCDVLYSVCCSEHGGTVFVDADQRRTVLRFRSESRRPFACEWRAELIFRGSRPTGLRTFGSLADGVVKLAGPGHRRSLRRLCSSGHDTCGRLNWESGIRARTVSAIPTYGDSIAHSCVH